MKKNMLAVLAVVLVLAVLGGLLATPVNAESLYIRKIVSVVYDDSTSMRGDNKWAYANYAMQCFCGMLNSEDRLFITYMSEAEADPFGYVPSESDLSADGIQQSVDDIRERPVVGSTPFDAVKIAYDKLRSVQDDNPNTQYWLVVITDGWFNEFGTISNAEKEGTRWLDQQFGDFINTQMPNRTNPKVTFLAIGDGVVSPTKDEDKGIFTYTANGSKDIVNTMAAMADRVSGRTRLERKDLRQVDDRTIEVSSAFPLLNIAVFIQQEEAGIDQAVMNGEVTLPISRQVDLFYPGYDDLRGGAFLLGNSEKSIGKGTVSITFDRPVSAENVVVLFEPALEMRMVASVNGKQLDDLYSLDETVEGDKLSVSCRIYEMGTDNEIDPSLLPPGTRYEISLSEDGEEVTKATGKDMKLDGVELHNKDTQLTAGLYIDGSAPITYSVRFAPDPYVPKVEYSLTADYGSDLHSVSVYAVGDNKDMTVCFSVSADGKILKDRDAVRELGPVITTSMPGCSGTTEIESDGRIVFTPNSLGNVPSGGDRFDVDVTCTLADGTFASLPFTVLLADYQVVPAGASGTAEKTDLYNNTVSASFYVTRDGERLDAAQLGNDWTASLKTKAKDLDLDVSVRPDGTLVCTPKSVKEFRTGFGNWFTNWWKYLFELPGRTMTVGMAYGESSATVDIPVGNRGLLWVLLNIVLPLVLELAAFVFLVTWIILILVKPRYIHGASLYVADIQYSAVRCTHILRDYSFTDLTQYNKFKYLWKFKKTAEIVDVAGVSIRADYAGRIICENLQPWYRDRITPVDYTLVLRTPKDISEYFELNDKLEIQEFMITDTIDNDSQRIFLASDPDNPRYIVVPNADGECVEVIDHRRVIRSGIIFVYTIN